MSRLTEMNPKNYYTYVVTAQLNSLSDIKVASFTPVQENFFITRIRVDAIDANGNNALLQPHDIFTVEVINDKKYFQNEPILLSLFECGGGDYSFLGRELQAGLAYKFNLRALPLTLANGNLQSAKSQYPIYIQISLDGYNIEREI